MMAPMALHEMAAEWSESSGAVDELALMFEGIDQEAQDALDIESFARGVTAPSREDPGGKAFVRSSRAKARVLTPRDIVRQALAAVFAVVAWGTLAELGVSEWFGVFGVAVAVFFGGSIPSLIDLFRAKRAAPVVRSTKDRFTLSV